MSEDDNKPMGDDVQQGEMQGRDPNTEGPDHPKMSGTGQPGSHSAVFGLTPDGSTDTNTKSSTTPVKPAHSNETSNTDPAQDDGSRGVSGSGVSEQMDDPKVAEKGHKGEAEP